MIVMRGVCIQHPVMNLKHNPDDGASTLTFLKVLHDSDEGPLYSISGHESEA